MIFLRFRPLLDLPVGVAQVRKEPLLSPVWSLSLCRASRCAGVMDFSTLTTDELSSVLQHLSAKQLFAVSNTSHELRTAARQALNAPRFAERKRWAPLGKRLLRVCQHSGRCILTEAPELVAFEEKYWRRTEQPGAGLWVPYDFTERDASPRAEASAASVSAVGRGYLRAVTPSRCVVRMTGPMEDDCQHVVPRCVCAPLLSLTASSTCRTLSALTLTALTLSAPQAYPCSSKPAISLRPGGSRTCSPCGPPEQRRSSRRGCTRCRTGTPAPLPTS